MVARLLEDQGFLIRERNVRIGRNELDLIAQRGDLLAIVEVRSRADERFGAPSESVDRWKLRRVTEAARGWLTAQREAGTLGTVRWIRIDIASVVFDRPGGRIQYYTNVTGF